MSLFDTLSAGLHEAQRGISLLGPRPSGDAAALIALAKVVRQEADNAATAGRLEQAIPGTIVFEGPAARRFEGNAGQVAQSLFVAQRTLDDAAATIERKAHQIAHAQAAWDRSHHGLLGQIADVARKLEHTTR